MASGPYQITVSATSGGNTFNEFVTITVSSTTTQITLTPALQTVSGAAGQTGVSINLTLTNNSASQRTFTLTAQNLPADISVRFPVNPITVNANSTFQFPVLVDFGSNVAVGQNIGTGQVVATSSDTGPAVTLTSTLLFSTTAGATATPQGCPDSPDPGNDQGGAQQILVDVPERHGICSTGDEDWFKFGAVGGKLYTIDIPQMDAGLDLSLDLYDADGNRLATNDDYYNRPSTTPTAGPGDIRPQIDSWRAPRDGTYYVRVRDTLNIGGSNKTYTIVVLSESYGPTPTQVLEICQDMFEPDGLPETARLITSNEIQRDHRLCPNGDADWVRFFGKTDKIYCIYTDTRPYNFDQRTNATPVNNPAEAGADTVLYLADRDGVSILDFNDDIERNDDLTRCIDPSPEPSLDSAIRFVPPADGFYYAQVKNTGDIGNQFIRYDLVLKLCLPNQECSRAPSAAPITQPQPSPRVGATPTATQDQFLLTRTPTGTPTPTETTGPDLFIENAARPGELINGPTRGFADRAFAQVWARNDQPIASQRATGSWTWGPRGLMARAESYMQTNGGLRQVQYFDKARMEISDPAGDRGSQWFVTTGLLVIELITGKTQLGDNQFVQHAPADIPIAGDSDDTEAPTYASFGGVTALLPGDRTGQLPAEAIDRAGRVSAYEGPTRPETRLAHFVAESGHNIPQIFWNYLNASGTIYEGGGFRQGQLLDWVFTLGYPISEPYWTHIRVGGADRQVLVQPFQRRVLTYSPDNPSGWRVEMGNVGRHYYRWRYGEELPAP